VPTHITFTNAKDGDQTMIDIFACAKQLHCRIRNCHTVDNGVDSDHAAVCLDLVLTLLKRADSTALTQGTTNWWKIATNKPTKQCYNDLLANATDSADMSYEEFNDAIKKQVRRQLSLSNQDVMTGSNSTLTSLSHS
jgi:hypothetical protein